MLYKGYVGIRVPYSLFGEEAVCCQVISIGLLASEAQFTVDVAAVELKQQA